MTSLNELANMAARHLPSGYELVLRVERGSGCVELWRDGVEIQLDCIDKDIEDQFESAINIANVLDPVPTTKGTS